MLDVALGLENKGSFVRDEAVLVFARCARGGASHDGAGLDVPRALVGLTVSRDIMPGEQREVTV